MIDAKFFTSEAIRVFGQGLPISFDVKKEQIESIELDEITLRLGAFKLVTNSFREVITTIISMAQISHAAAHSSTEGATSHQ